ncbi:MAG: SAM-dependent DNA methyltransferase [Chloroflexi bacterium]|nr:MAG: SAM-dependent DNA methyltransferase [Chloroflexota bacterium]
MIELDILESQRLEIQHKIDITKTQDERNKLGQFATPTQLALDITEYANSFIIQDTTLRFLDPAFGTGSFFSALRTSFSPSRISAVTGYEIDPVYGDAAVALWKDERLKVHIADFTKATPPAADENKANLLICNPPYVRHHYLSKAEKQRLQKKGEQITGVKLGEQTGLYGHFLLISHAWMAHSALAGWLIPSEFMDVRYGQQIKQYLLKKVTLLHIHCFKQDHVQFNDALVSSSIVWFKNAPPPVSYDVEFSYGGTLTRPEARKFIRNDELADSKKWTKIFSRQEASASKIEGRVQKYYTFEEFTSIKIKIDSIDRKSLADFFNVKRGLATGNNNFFLLTQELIKKYQLPIEFIKPVLPNPRYLLLDEVHADDKGYPLLESNLFLLDCHLPEEEVKAKYTSLWRYLQIGIETEVHKGYICSNRQPWYTQEKRPACLFLCAYMGRKNAKKDKPFRFLLNHSKATATNAYHMLYPRPFLQKALEQTPEIIQPLWQALCAIPSEILVDEGRVYGGGLHKMEPKELANVPADTVLEVLQTYRSTNW